MQFQNQDSNDLDFHFNQGVLSLSKNKALTLTVGSYFTLPGTHFGAYTTFPASPGNFLSSPTTHGGYTNVVGSPVVHFAGCSSSREAHS
ncbi:hypothetical protein V6N11_012107 [Hibiscus sabdariffa]|uniref:Uncharacterized protein n=1 Tax=Hibiscus sabdariffa TaxID=183260 RepID=A0ABR2QA61_9ROSI